MPRIRKISHYAPVLNLTEGGVKLHPYASFAVTLSEAKHLKILRLAFGGLRMTYRQFIFCHSEGVPTGTTEESVKNDFERDSSSPAGTQNDNSGFGWT
ncbi:MAG: hypothetical protein A2W07_08110 [candidate division Zixibacteria bacterium RBG_16_43_9]|nr:MAG: hypothetical protein A2W07_08110 [candidate division Zixibacteria bacterium RBG_16_43_9]